jgi:hypothetical protein
MTARAVAKAAIILLQVNSKKFKFIFTVFLQKTYSTLILSMIIGPILRTYCTLRGLSSKPHAVILNHNPLAMEFKEPYFEKRL